MGYTHYWEIKKPLTEEVLKDISEKTQQIVDLAKEDGIIICNGMGEEGSEPTITPTYISLNGCETEEEDNSHESFYIRLEDKGFQFCKTARKPYDAVVVSILKYCKDNYSEYFKISSDGGDIFNIVPYDV
jgi:hypothetical protein